MFYINIIPVILKVRDVLYQRNPSASLVKTISLNLEFSSDLWKIGAFAGNDFSRAWKPSPAERNTVPRFGTFPFPLFYG